MRCRILRAPILSRALATAGWSMRLLFICRLACDADHSTQSLVGRRGGCKTIARLPRRLAPRKPHPWARQSGRRVERLVLSMLITKRTLILGARGGSGERDNGERR